MLHKSVSMTLELGINHSKGFMSYKMLVVFVVFSVSVDKSG